jgi:adenylate cyclase
MESPSSTKSGKGRLRALLASFFLPTLLWALFSGLVLVLLGTGAFERIDNIFYDRCFMVRNAVEKERIARWREMAAKSVAIVSIDDLSFELLGIDKTPTRNQWALLVQRLGLDEENNSRGASIVSFDYYLPKISYPPKDMEFVHRTLVTNVSKSLQSLSALSLGGERPQSEVVRPEDTQGVLHDLGLVSVEYQEFLRTHEDERYNHVYRILKKREIEVSRTLGEGEEKLYKHLREMDPRLLAALEGSEEGFVHPLRKLYGTIVNSLLVADINLCASMLTKRNVILAKFIDEGGIERESDEIFKASAVGQGLINAIKDTDGKLRSIPFVRWKISEGDSFESEFGLSVISVIHYEDIPEDQVGHCPEGYRIGRHMLPLTFFLNINYIGKARSFPYIPLYRILHEQIRPEVRARLEAQGVVIEPPMKPSEIEGRIVLVGDTSVSGQDFVPTPFSALEAGIDQSQAHVELDDRGSHTETPGVECHANAIFSILHDTFIVPLSNNHTILLVVLFAMLGSAFYLQRIGLVLSLFLFIVLLSATTLLTFILFSQHYLWIMPAPLLAVLGINFVGGVAYQGIASQMKKKAITNIFGKYVSDNLVKKMVAGELEVDLKGRTANITVLFSDIRGFTKLSEKLTPEMVGDLLHVYFSRMIKIIFLEEGTLDKLMGDAIMAFFGDPDEQPEHPSKACDAALKMLEDLALLKRESDIPVMKDLDIGIGLNTGLVTVGNLGSDEYVDYTVIGDNVNLGSRLEGLNKVYGTSIIISQYTRERVLDGFETRSLGSVRVMGKTLPVEIYELLGRRGDVSKDLLKARDAFEKGIALWREARFKEAMSKFQEVLAMREGDGPSMTFIERCRAMMESEPEENWDGIYSPKSK